MVNLYDRLSLNNVIENIIYHGTKPGLDNGNFSLNDLKNKKFIQYNSDTLIRAMILRWFERRFIATLSHADIEFAINSGWLKPISSTHGREKWLKNALDKGCVVYDFIPEKFNNEIVDKIMAVRDFFYEVCRAYIGHEIHRPNSAVNIDFLKTVNQYDTFKNVTKLSAQWHKKQKQKYVQRNVAEQDTHLFMEYSDGHVIRKLLTASALKAEGSMMGHCLGNGAYDESVADATIEIYSLRGPDGIAHVTLEVNAKNKTVKQCKGQANTMPVRKYIPYICQFMRKAGLVPEQDLQNMGLVRATDGKLYDLYNLPENLVLDNLVLNYTNGVNVPAGTKCKKLDLWQATNFTLAENVVVEDLSLGMTDGAKVPATPKYKKVILCWAKNFTLPENLIADELLLGATDGANVRTGTKCKKLDLDGAKNFILSERVVVDELSLKHTNGAIVPAGLKCKKLFLQNAKNFMLPAGMAIAENGDVHYKTKSELYDMARNAQVLTTNVKKCVTGPALEKCR